MSKSFTVYFDRRKFIIAEDISNHSTHGIGLYVSSNSPDETANLLFFFKSAPIIQTLCSFGANSSERFEKFKGQFTYIVAAGGLVKNKAGHYLLIQRNGLWDLPKGKGEDGESAQQTAQREVSEECGLQGPSVSWHLTDTYHTYSQGAKEYLKRTVWYHMEVCEATMLKPQLEEGITECRWVALSDLNQYLANTYPSIVDVFKSELGATTPLLSEEF